MLRDDEDLRVLLVEELRVVAVETGWGCRLVFAQRANHRTSSSIVAVVVFAHHLLLLGERNHLVCAAANHRHHHVVLVAVGCSLHALHVAGVLLLLLGVLHLTMGTSALAHAIDAIVLHVHLWGSLPVAKLHAVVEHVPAALLAHFIARARHLLLRLLVADHALVLAKLIHDLLLVAVHLGHLVALLPALSAVHLVHVPVLVAVHELLLIVNLWRQVSTVLKIDAIVTVLCSFVHVVFGAAHLVAMDVPEAFLPLQVAFLVHDDVIVRHSLHAWRVVPILLVLTPRRQNFLPVADAELLDHGPAAVVTQTTGTIRHDVAWVTSMLVHATYAVALGLEHRCLLLRGGQLAITVTSTATSHGARGFLPVLATVAIKVLHHRIAALLFKRFAVRSNHWLLPVRLRLAVAARWLHLLLPVLLRLTHVGLPVLLLLLLLELNVDKLLHVACWLLLLRHLLLLVVRVLHRVAAVLRALVLLLARVLLLLHHLLVAWLLLVERHQLVLLRVQRLTDLGTITHHETCHQVQVVIDLLLLVRIIHVLLVMHSLVAGLHEHLVLPVDVAMHRVALHLSVRKLLVHHVLTAGHHLHHAWHAVFLVLRLHAELSLVVRRDLEHVVLRAWRVK